MANRWPPKHICVRTTNLEQDLLRASWGTLLPHVAWTKVASAVLFLSVAALMVSVVGSPDMFCV